MKKLSYLFVAAGIFAFVACGPSAKEKEAEQLRLDSLKQDSIMKADAAKEQARMDSLNAAKEQAKQDSIKNAEEAKKK